MKQILLRVFAVFGYSAMGIIGGASVLGDIRTCHPEEQQ